MKFETRAIREAHSPDPTTRAVITPIHVGTTFQFTEVGVNTGFDYSRSANPTRAALERVLASLEGGRHGIAFASGMAATDAVLSVLLPGENIVAAKNLYGGTLRLFESIYTPRQVQFRYVGGDSMEEFIGAIDKKTRMVWLETPTNPQLQIIDIRAVSEICRELKIPLVVDNTFASPYFQQPLGLGADVVLHSTTKYIAGHHDVIGGAVVTSDPWWHEKMLFFQNTAGAVPSAFDCYLTLRGLKTLALRMKAHQENALAVAEYLQRHPKVTSVLYPGLPDFPQHELAKKQMSGFGGMVTFSLDLSEAQLNAMAASLKVFHFAESLGGTESLICHPTTMSHAVLTDEERASAGIIPGMLRLSIGLEHHEDLIEDLDQALAIAFKTK